MFTEIQTFNGKAMVIGAAFRKMIFERLPEKIIDEMHTVDLTGKTDREIISSITNAGRTAKKWEAARENLGLKATLKIFDKKHPKLDSDKPGRSERKKSKQGSSDRNKFKRDRTEPKSRRHYSKTEGIDPSEVEQ
jgi:hypothetical protein